MHCSSNGFPLLKSKPFADRRCPLFNHLKARASFSWGKVNPKSVIRCGSAKKDGLEASIFKAKTNWPKPVHVFYAKPNTTYTPFTRSNKHRANVEKMYSKYTF